MEADISNDNLAGGNFYPRRLKLEVFDPQMCMRFRLPPTVPLNIVINLMKLLKNAEQGLRRNGIHAVKLDSGLRICKNIR